MNEKAVLQDDSQKAVLQDSAAKAVFDITLPEVSDDNGFEYPLEMILIG